MSKQHKKQSNFTPKPPKKQFINHGKNHDNRCHYASIISGMSFCNKHKDVTGYICFDRLKG